MNSPQPPDAVRICRFPSQEVEMTSPLRRMRAGLALGTGLALLCACALAAAAQTTGTIRGKVTDATTGRPVDGAQLYVAGTDLGTLPGAPACPCPRRGGCRARGRAPGLGARRASPSPTSRSYTWTACVWTGPAALGTTSAPGAAAPLRAWTI